jgi:hypothetical protein
VDPCRGGTLASGRGISKGAELLSKERGTCYRTFDAPYHRLKPLRAADGRLDEVTSPNVSGMTPLLYSELSSAIKRISSSFVLP